MSVASSRLETVKDHLKVWNQFSVYNNLDAAKYKSLLAYNVSTQEPHYLPCSHRFFGHSWPKHRCKDRKVGSIRCLCHTLYLVSTLALLGRAWRDIHAFLNSQTNSDGRCPTLLPEGYKAEEGIYRVTFETKAFFSKIGQECFYPYVQVSI